MTHDERYFARASGEVGYEIVSPDGEVVAWAVDGWWTAEIVGLLNDEVSRHHRVPEPA
jgi:hypothetical protein